MKRTVIQWLFEYIYTQRKGLTILCVVLCCLVLWQCLPKKEDVEKISSSVDSLLCSGKRKWTHCERRKAVHPRRTKPKLQLFRFDPNTLSDTGFLQLGLNGGQVACIMAYRKKGKFRTATDFSKLYVINKEQFNQLAPYINITDTSYARPNKNHNNLKKNKQTLELNTADSAQLVSLPLIGAKRAQTIIRFRNRLGGFYCITQLHEVYGLPDSVIQRIMPLVWIDTTHICRIDLNTAEYKDFQKHPYIGAQRAKQLLEYRRIKGTISQTTDLQDDHIFSSDDLSKILPYLRVE